MNYPNMYVKGNKPNTLCQGDIFLNFNEDIIPNYKGWEKTPYIVLSFSCDLSRPKRILFLVVAPILKLDELLMMSLEKKKISNSEEISKKKNEIFCEIFEIANSKTKFFFFLSPIEELDNTPLYTDLSRVFSIPKKYIDVILQNRIKCLKSPWREKLGYKLGYLYNRVAINDEDEVEKQIIKDYIFEKNKEMVEKFIKTE